MNTVYVTGHKNPDFDSISSAVVYAHLMRHVDREINYVPIRCGNLNTQSKMIYEKLNIAPPVYLQDVFPKVEDVVIREVPKLTITDPLQTAIVQLDNTGLSILPVFDVDGTFLGTISSVEISHFLIRETFGARPQYRFLVENLAKVIPGRLVHPGEQENFIAPVMIGAMPFDQSIQTIETLGGKYPLFIVGLREDLIRFVIQHKVPALVLTGAKEEDLINLDLKNYPGAVFLSDVDTAETIRLLRFSTPLYDIFEKKTQCLDIKDDFEEAKEMLASSGRRGLPVFDGDDFAGIVSRGSFLNKPKKRLVMVDHNEVEQSVAGASMAEIVEIVDHHRVGSFMSREPFSLNVRPVGCTCTILHALYQQYSVAIPMDMALLMLSAILSDTVLLKSPTATKEDRKVVEALARHAGVDWKTWGEEMFSNESSPKDLRPEEAVGADFKTYESGKIKFGIGQAEVQTLSGTQEVVEAFQKALDSQRSEKGLVGAMLLLTDVIHGDSILILRGLEDASALFPYEHTAPGVYALPGILSRKKQLLPDVLRAVEEVAGRQN